MTSRTTSRPPAIPSSPDGLPGRAPPRSRRGLATALPPVLTGDREGWGFGWDLTDAQIRVLLHAGLVVAMASAVLLGAEDYRSRVPLTAATPPGSAEPALPIDGPASIDGRAPIDGLSPIEPAPSSSAGSRLPRSTGSTPPQSPRDRLRLKSLNRLDRDQLTACPGIGPGLAARILDARPPGGFTRLDQLLEVSGIGRRRYATLIDHLEPGNPDAPSGL